MVRIPFLTWACLCCWAVCVESFLLVTPSQVIALPFLDELPTTQQYCFLVPYQAGLTPTELRKHLFFTGDEFTVDMPPFNVKTLSLGQYEFTLPWTSHRTSEDEKPGRSLCMCCCDDRACENKTHCVVEQLHILPEPFSLDHITISQFMSMWCIVCGIVLILVKIRTMICYHQKPKSNAELALERIALYAVVKESRRLRALCQAERQGPRSVTRRQIRRENAHLYEDGDDYMVA